MRVCVCVCVSVFVCVSVCVFQSASSMQKEMSDFNYRGDKKQDAQIDECHLIYTLFLNSKSVSLLSLFLPEGTVLAPHHCRNSPHTEFKMLFCSELRLILRSGMASAHFQTWQSPRKASRCYGTPPLSSPTSHCCLSAPIQTPWREQLGLCRT